MYLYGASEHAKVIIDTILSLKTYRIKAVYDDFIKEKSLFEIPIINDINTIPKNEKIYN